MCWFHLIYTKVWHLFSLAQFILQCSKKKNGLILHLRKNPKKELETVLRLKFTQDYMTVHDLSHLNSVNVIQGDHLDLNNVTTNLSFTIMMSLGVGSTEQLLSYRFTKNELKCSNMLLSNSNPQHHKRGQLPNIFDFTQFTQFNFFT